MLRDLWSQRVDLIVDWPADWVAPDGSRPGRYARVAEAAGVAITKAAVPGSEALTVALEPALPPAQDAASWEPAAALPVYAAPAAEREPKPAKPAKPLPPVPPPPAPRPFGDEPCCAIGARADYLAIAEALRWCGQPGRETVKEVAERTGIPLGKLAKHRSMCLMYPALTARVPERTWVDMAEPLRERAMAAIRAMAERCDEGAEDTNGKADRELSDALLAAIAWLEDPPDPAQAEEAARAQVAQNAAAALTLKFPTLTKREEAMVDDLTKIIAAGQYHGWNTACAVGRRHGWDNHAIATKMTALHRLAVERVARMRGPKAAQIEAHIASFMAIQARTMALVEQYRRDAEMAYKRCDVLTARLANQMMNRTLMVAINAEKAAAAITLAQTKVSRAVAAAVQVNIANGNVRTQMQDASATQEVLVRILRGVCPPNMFAMLAPSIDEGMSVYEEGGDVALVNWLADKHQLLSGMPSVIDMVTDDGDNANAT